MITEQEIIEILDKKISVKCYSPGIPGGINGKPEAAKAIMDKIKEKENYDNSLQSVIDDEYLKKSLD